MAVDFDKGWTAGELADHAGWLFTATQQEQRALIELAQQIEAQIGGDPNRLLQMRRADFDLGPLAGRLDAMMQEIRERSGVVLYRGLPMDALSRLGTAILYWALGVHLGTPQSNNPEGDMIGHVVNIGADYKQPNQRGYQTAVEMDYHCDQTDLVGLLCIHEAKSGGLSKITSSRLLYHILKARRPDLVAVLCQPFCWTKHAETGSREKPYYESPVFNFTDGTLSTSFGPTHIFKGHQLADAPDMTAVQKQAIEAAWALADELHYAMRLQRGDGYSWSIITRCCIPALPLKTGRTRRGGARSGGYGCRLRILCRAPLIQSNGWAAWPPREPHPALRSIIRPGRPVRQRLGQPIVQVKPNRGKRDKDYGSR